MGQVNIIVNEKKGTSTNNHGEFSIKVRANDTLRFSHIGFYPITIFIEDSIKEGELVAKLFLINDTVNLEEVVVNSLTDYEDFKDSFLKMSEDKNLINAKNNINQSIYLSRTTTEYTVEDRLEKSLQKEANKSIYYGQIPPDNMIDVRKVVKSLLGISAQKKKNKMLYKQFINLQNQNNLVYIKSSSK